MCSPATTCRGAGTDANVSCVLYGSGGDSAVQRLESSANDFERGKVRPRGGGGGGILVLLMAHGYVAAVGDAWHAGGRGVLLLPVAGGKAAAGGGGGGTSG
jgi:hypothetical protein